MKNHKKIFEKSLKNDGFRTDLMTSDSLLEAMDIAAKQAFEAARSEIKNEKFDLGLDDFDSYSILKYKTFEDYLKDLEDGNN